MSTTVMGACWPLQMPPTQKAVLMSLADNANDHGECWPSLPTIGERTCFGRTAVIDAIRWLEEQKLIVADRSNGRHTRYRILVGTDVFQASKPVRIPDRSAKRTGSDAGENEPVEPSKPVRLPDPSASRTGSGERPYPSASRTQPVRQADSNRQEPSRTVIRRNRGARLPDDWSPSIERKAEAKDRYPGVDLDAATEEFRNFWIAEPDPRGSKLDWDRVWMNRIADLSKSRRGAAVPAPKPSGGAATVHGKPKRKTPADRRDEHLDWLRAELAAERVTPEQHAAQVRECRQRFEELQT